MGESMRARLGVRMREHERGVKPDALEPRGSSTGRTGGCCVSAPAAPPPVCRLHAQPRLSPRCQTVIVSFIFSN